MRTIKELLQLVRDTFLREPITSNRYSYSGLCDTINVLRWTDVLKNDEVYLIKSYMKDNTPVTTFYDSSGDITNDPDEYWWPMYEKENRLAWLDKHISVFPVENDSAFGAKES
jgi:hypothetical protein